MVMRVHVNRTHPDAGLVSFLDLCLSLWLLLLLCTIPAGLTHASNGLCVLSIFFRLL